jgi:hypothetical protein
MYLNAGLMKNRLAALGILGLTTTFAIAACSGDDDTGAPGAPTAGTGGKGGGGDTSAGTTSGGTSTAGSSSAGTSTGVAGGGVAGGGVAGGGVAGGTTSIGGEAGAGGTPVQGGESGMAGVAPGGAGGADAAGAGGDGGASGEVEEVVTLTPTTCSYTEVESNSSQPTGLDAKTALKVICGKVDTGHFSAGDHLLDKDTYGIALKGGEPVLMRLELPTFSGLTRVEVLIDQDPIVITKPVTVFNMYSLFSSALVRISAYSAADLSESIPYQLSIVSDDVDARCAANTGAAAFTEAGDAANNRGNDVYVFDYAVPSATSGTAEATGITLDHASYRVNGKSADVARLGDFLDGDSYRFHTGPSTTQVTLRADWQGSHDLDLFVMKAGTLERAGYSTLFSNSSPEYVTVRVKPNTDYVAFAGGQGGSPFDYSLTLCGETYSFNGP